MKRSKRPEDGKTTQMRIDAALWNDAALAAQRSGRTARQEIEARLQLSLTGMTEGISPALAPKAAALGRLVAFLANDVIEHSDSKTVVPLLKASSEILFQRLGAKDVSADVQAEARTFADYLFLRLKNAAERTFKDGKPVPLSQEQLELAEIRETLGEWFTSASSG